MNQQADLPPIAASLDAPERSDPDLVALPAPPKRERTAATALMIVTAAASAAMCWALFGEVKYAFSTSTPADVGDLATLQPSVIAPGTYVEGRGLLASEAALRYQRPLEGDSFRLQQVAANPKVWVEIRVPEGIEGPRFVPPNTFAGRLVPLRKAGLRHTGLVSSVERETGKPVAEDAWVVMDGASPRASRWAGALFGLFVFFFVWNVVSVVRILRPVRD